MKIIIEKNLFHPIVDAVLTELNDHSSVTNMEILIHILPLCLDIENFLQNQSIKATYSTNESGFLPLMQ